MDNLPDLGISPTPEMNKITINTEGAQNFLQHLKVTVRHIKRPRDITMSWLGKSTEMW
jgi:hypothetical protein